MIPRHSRRGEPPYDRKRVVAAFEPQMTVGIVVIPPMDNAIVTVSDMMVSFDDSMPAIDTGMLKETRLDDNWGFLFAGATSRVPMLRDRARRLVERIAQADRTVLTIGDAVASAYQQTRTEQIIYQYLMMYNIKTMEEFLEKGLSTFGVDKFAELTRKIEQYDFGMEVLVYGFGVEGEPHIVEIANPGIALIRDPLPQWAIGSGTFMALGVLNSRDSICYLSAAEAVYRACEAKFSAETAAGVGLSTAAAIWRAGQGIPEVLSDGDVEELRAIWNQTKNYPVPQEAIKIVGDAILRVRPGN